MIEVPGGKIYYEISNPNAEGIPLLLIHGGPGGTYSDPDYVAATDSFYAEYLFNQPRKDVPECRGVSGNADRYNTMWGPTELTATGTLLDYDRSDRLSELTLPTLLTTGGFDEARPETMVRFADMMPNASVEIVPDAGHMALVD